MTNLRDKIARAVARAQDADYWVDEIANWEALEEWERDAYPGEYPGLAYEDQRDFRQAADAVLAVIDLDKVRAEAWDEGHESAAMRVPEGVWHDVAAPHPGNPHRKAEQ